MQNLTKRDIVIKISKETGLIQQKVMQVVQKTLDIIADAVVQGRNVELRNFGVFEVRIRKSRVGRNPNKPHIDIPIPEQPVVKFKAGKELQKRVIDAYAHRTNQSVNLNPIPLKGSEHLQKSTDLSQQQFVTGEKL